MMASKLDVLKLYKSCLVYVNTLKYSDKDYLRNRIREEFRKVKSDEHLDYYYNKGLSFLERKRLS